MGIQIVASGSQVSLRPFIVGIVPAWGMSFSMHTLERLDFSATCISDERPSVVVGFLLMHSCSSVLIPETGVGLIWVLVAMRVPHPFPRFRRVIFTRFLLVLPAGCDTCYKSGIFHVTVTMERAFI